jgi:hypothetical protein
LKKTEIDLKKTRQIRLSEEDGRRRKHPFVTAGTRQIQLGGHMAAAKRICRGLGCSEDMLLPDETYVSFVNNGEITRARLPLHKLDIKGYRELRAAYAWPAAALRPDCDTFEAHFSVTPSNSAGFRAPSRKKPRYMDC